MAQLITPETLERLSTKTNYSIIVNDEGEAIGLLISPNARTEDEWREIIDREYEHQQAILDDGTSLPISWWDKDHTVEFTPAEIRAAENGLAEFICVRYADISKAEAWVICPEGMS